MNLTGYLRVLRGHWFVITVTIGASLVLAIAYTLLATPTYQARSQLFITVGVADSAASVYQSGRAAQQKIDSYVAILEGRRIAEEVVNDYGLGVTVDQLANGLSVRAVPRTALILVAYRDSSPERARDIANGVSEEFVRLLDEMQQSDPRDARANAMIVETASRPTSPITPRTSRDLSFALACGIILGVALAFLLDRRDTTVKTLDDLSAVTGSTGLVQLSRSDTTAKQFVMDFARDHTSFAEEVRMLRSTLRYLSNGSVRVLLVTSASSGEGKSTTSANLAAALAEQGATVVLLEADLRHPRMTDRLGLSTTVGISSVLTGRVDLETACQSSGYDGLHHLGSGPLPPNPSELLGSQAAATMIAELRRLYDYVIIDTPPALAVTDAATLAHQADGVLLVAEHSKTTRSEVASVTLGIESVGGSIVGCVLTMTPPPTGLRHRLSRRTTALPLSPYGNEPGRFPQQIVTGPDPGDARSATDL